MRTLRHASAVRSFGTGMAQRADQKAGSSTGHEVARLARMARGQSSDQLLVGTLQVVGRGPNAVLTRPRHFLEVRCVPMGGTNNPRGADAWSAFTTGGLRTGWHVGIRMEHNPRAMRVRAEAVRGCVARARDALGRAESTFTEWLALGGAATTTGVVAYYGRGAQAIELAKVLEAAGPALAYQFVGTAGFVMGYLLTKRFLNPAICSVDPSFY